MSKALVYSTFKYARLSPKKARPVANLVRGKNIQQAKLILKFDTTKAAKMIFKVLKAVESNAKNNLNLVLDNLYLSDVRIDEAPVLRGMKINGKANAVRLAKRTSHIVVGLSERAK